MHPCPSKDAPMVMPTRRSSLTMMMPIRRVSGSKPLTMPKRKSSISKNIPSFPKPFSKVLSHSHPSSSSLAVSQDSSRELSSLNDFEVGGEETFRSSSTSFQVPDSEELRSLFKNAVVIEANQEEGGRRVSFAPRQSITRTSPTLCLDEYTMEEIESCWYTYDDIKYMRQKRKRKQRRKIFKKKSKRLQRKVLKSDARWTA